MADDRSVTITRRIRATPEELFDAWTDPESMRHWMCPGDAREARARLDVRVGGTFQIDMIKPNVTYEHTGEYLVVDRPHRLSFTWVSVPTSGQRTLVTVQFTAVGPDETELTLTHEGFPNADSAASHRTGWGSILDKLTTKATSSD